MGVYGEFDTYRPFEGHTDSQKPLVSKDSGADNAEVGVYQPFRLSSQQAPPLPNRPASHNQPAMELNEIYQTEDPSEDDHFSKLGPRLDPEGGDWGGDWIQLSAYHLTYLNFEIFIPWHLCDYLQFSLARSLFSPLKSVVLHQSQAHKITLFRPACSCYLILSQIKLFFVFKAVLNHPLHNSFTRSFEFEIPCVCIFVHINACWGVNLCAVYIL